MARAGVKSELACEVLIARRPAGSSMQSGRNMQRLRGGALAERLEVCDDLASFVCDRHEREGGGEMVRW